jgi:hypothetical protein
MIHIPEWYTEWSAAHIAAFNLGRDAAEDFAIWGVHWSQVYSEEDLHDATADMRGTAALLYNHTPHRTAIPAAVASIRDRKRRKATATLPPDFCRACNGTGVAIVPHPGFDEAGNLRSPLAAHPYKINQFGEPTFVDLAVTCSCPLGQHLDRGASDRLAAGTIKAKRMRLDTYEFNYPNWRMIAYAIGQMRKAAHEPRPANAAADIAARVAEKAVRK